MYCYLIGWSKLNKWDVELRRTQAQKTYGLVRWANPADREKRIQACKEGWVVRKQGVT